MLLCHSLVFVLMPSQLKFVCSLNTAINSGHKEREPYHSGSMSRHRQKIFDSKMRTGNANSSKLGLYLFQGVLWN